MDSVWVVTTGMYIECIFSDEATARQYAASLGGDSVSVDEYGVDSTFDPSRVYWHVGLAERDGHLWNADRYEALPPAVRLNWFERYNTLGREQFDDYHGGGHLWSGWVQAPTEEAAIKIAQEQLAMTLAQAHGMT